MVARLREFVSASIDRPYIYLYILPLYTLIAINHHVFVVAFIIHLTLLRIFYNPLFSRYTFKPLYRSRPLGIYPSLRLVYLKLESFVAKRRAIRPSVNLPHTIIALRASFLFAPPHRTTKYTRANLRSFFCDSDLPFPIVFFILLFPPLPFPRARSEHRGFAPRFR